MDEKREIDALKAALRESAREIAALKNAAKVDKSVIATLKREFDKRGDEIATLKASLGGLKIDGARVDGAIGADLTSTVGTMETECTYFACADVAAGEAWVTSARGPAWPAEGGWTYQQVAGRGHVLYEGPDCAEAERAAARWQGTS